MSDKKELEKNDDNYITLEFDDGDVECEILGLFTVN